MPGDPTQRPVVLVVADDPALAEWLAEPLRSAFEIRRAYDPTQAGELLDADVDVVLLDVATAGLDSWRFVGRLRRRDVACRVALVVGPEVDTVALEVDADDYVTRPALADVVRETVDRLAEVAKYDRDLREFYELARRKAVLEARLSPAALAASSEYADLLVELDGYRDLLDVELRQLDADRDEIVFRELAAA